MCASLSSCRRPRPVGSGFHMRCRHGPSSLFSHGTVKMNLLHSELAQSSHSWQQWTAAPEIFSCQLLLMWDCRGKKPILSGVQWKSASRPSHLKVTFEFPRIVCPWYISSWTLVKVFEWVASKLWLKWQTVVLVNPRGYYLKITCEGQNPQSLLWLFTVILDVLRLENSSLPTLTAQTDLNIVTLFSLLVKLSNLALHRRINSVSQSIRCRRRARRLIEKVFNQSGRRTQHAGKKPSKFPRQKSMKLQKMNCNVVRDHCLKKPTVSTMTTMLINNMGFRKTVFNVTIIHQTGFSLRFVKNKDLIIKK